MEPSSPNSRIRFGKFEVNLHNGELRQQGHRIRIQPQPLKVLAVLLERPGELVTRDDLRKRLWPGQLYVDFEHGLNRSINKLRRALLDETSSPLYIETITTRGYRFIAPLERFEVDAVEVSVQGKSGSEAVHVGVEIANGAIQAKPRNLRRWWLSGIGVFAIGIIFMVWMILRRPLPQPHITRYNQITRDGHQKTPVGTDGSRVYLTHGPPPTTVAQVAISGGEIVPIPVSVPSLISLDDVSPDGSNLLVESRETPWFKAPSAIWIVGIPGGPIRRLHDGFASAFSSDGTSVLYSSEKGDIYLVRSDGTAARKLASVGGEVHGLAWSPDGGIIRFERGDNKIWQVSSDGSNLHELLPSWRNSSWKCCGRWTPDGRFYLFLSSGSDSEADQIWALDERRGMFRHPPTEPVQLTTGPIDWSPPIPAKDGRTILADGNTPRGELSRFDPQTKQFQPFLGGISAQFVSFSPNGKFVAYVTYPEWTLWKANRDGTNPMQLSDRSIITWIPRWSPDGTQILFSDITSGSEAYLVSAQGGAPRKLLPEVTGVQTDPDWSPDGHKIVFGSSFGGHDPKSVIRIFDLDTREVSIVPGSTGMTDPRWSPDGRFIAANSFDLLTMNIFDFGTQRWLALSPKILMSCPVWSKDSRFIYFIHEPDGPALYRLRVNGGGLEKVVDLKNWPIAEPGGCLSLDPTDAPLLLRDISSNDIFALTLDR